MSTGAYEFYEIKSAKSRELVDGLHKVSLFCIDQPDIYCFLWFELESLKQIQLIFDEKVIQWIKGQGWSTAETNRRRETIQKTGHQKGVRTIHQQWNPKILEEGRKIIRMSDFPPIYKQFLMNKLDS